RPPGPDAVPASAAAVGLRSHPCRHEPPPYARGLSRRDRAHARGTGGSRAVVRLHRRLSGRERRRFPRHHEGRGRPRLRRRILVQVFAAARHPRRRDGAGSGRGEERAPAASAGCHRPPAGGVQCGLPRPHLRYSPREAGTAPGPAGGPLALFAAGPRPGAGVADRRDRCGDDHRCRRQQPVRSARGRRPCHVRLQPGFGHRRSLMRTLRPDEAIVPPTDPGDGATQAVLAFDDNRLASVLFGQYGQNLALIERRLGVAADSRGNHVTIEGPRDAVEQARRVLESLYDQTKRGHDLVPGDVEGAVRHALAQRSLFDFDPGAGRPGLEEINLRKRPVRARTAGQDAYIRALKRYPLVFGAGPPGTGQTWLAVAHAVALFERKEVDRIVLSRPAVEAGERLGFLPGDMREKVDPYLRPIYDALFDLMDARITERALQTGEIEIAPLAFMRGRTLSNAAVILDEAQNTTSMQMKMFLTRLGENSRMIVTGDPSQVDLPAGQTSGLHEALRLLADVEGIGVVAFTAQDVIRHELVGRIVQAYDKAAAQKREGHES